MLGAKRAFGRVEKGGESCSEGGDGRGEDDGAQGLMDRASYRRGFSPLFSASVQRSNSLRAARTTCTAPGYESPSLSK